VKKSKPVLVFVSDARSSSDFKEPCLSKFERDVKICGLQLMVTVWVHRFFHLPHDCTFHWRLTLDEVWASQNIIMGLGFLDL
jgi:hypothetical protein